MGVLVLRVHRVGPCIRWWGTLAHRLYIKAWRCLNTMDFYLYKVECTAVELQDQDYSIQKLIYWIPLLYIILYKR